MNKEYQIILSVILGILSCVFSILFIVMVINFYVFGFHYRNDYYAATLFLPLLLSSIGLTIRKNWCINNGGNSLSKFALVINCLGLIPVIAFISIFIILLLITPFILLF